MTALAIEFPVIGISGVRPGVPYAFVATTRAEMHESPLHLFFRGYFKNHYFVDKTGVRYFVEHPRITGLDLIRIREVGVVTSVVSALLSGFNFPVMVSFDLRWQGIVEIEDLRRTALAVPGRVAPLLHVERHGANRQTTLEGSEGVRGTCCRSDPLKCCQSMFVSEDS